MNIITYVQNIEELQECITANINEIILEPKPLSRFGKLDLETFINLAQHAKKHNIKVACEWDILNTEKEFGKATDFFQTIPTDLYQSVRVQDPGACEYVFQNTTKPITLILETGHHNLNSHKRWINYLGNRLEKIVLSIELSKDSIADYCHLNVPMEILVLGRILLFYTPRNLLSTMLPETDEARKKTLFDDRFIEATGESEESPHKGFPLIENSHGTFMFHIKRLSLIEHLAELSSLGLSTIRYDGRFDDQFMARPLEQLLQAQIDILSFKKDYPYEAIKGYYNINKSDVLFKKLKNTRIQRKDDSYIGEVLEASKGNYLAIMIKKHSIQMSDELKFITPEGKELFCKVHTLKNSNLNDADCIDDGHLALMNYFGGVWPKSQVYILK